MANGVTTNDNHRARIAAARFSLGSAIFLAAAKFAAGLLTGSLGILASALDNVADIFMSSVNYVSIRKSMEPADREHPYGHGKVEPVATLFQGAVITLTGGWVIREGILRLRAGTAPGSPDEGILVMLFSVVASGFVASRIRKAGEVTGSTALRADALHFRTDVYSGTGILLSLVAYRLTGWKWLDPGTALAVGAYILLAALPLLRAALEDLTDRQLPPESVATVERIINDHRPMVMDFHDLRTRRAGSERHVDFHVVVCRRHRLEDAHRVADHLEEEVRQALGGAHVVTHLDPCEFECPEDGQCTRVTEMIRELSSPEEEQRRRGDAPGGDGPHRA